MNLSIVVSAQPAKFEAATFKGDLATNLNRIASYGYGGVELAIRDPNAIDLDALESMIRKNGLTVPAIGTGHAWGEDGLSFTDPEPGIRQATIERVKRHIPFASRFGALIIIGLIRGVVRADVDRRQAMDWLVAALSDCSQAARSAGVRLALEPINRYETTLINDTSQGLDMVERVGADNFGLLLDTFHMNIEEANIEASIKGCGKHTFHFHIADSNRWFPGAGHLDFKSILNALFATGYQGWISGEFLPHPDPETAAKKCIAHISRITS